jgi:glycosyltransferase involved in cell wall biosynthesis
LANEARKSDLLKDQKIVSIPNPIDTDIFKPLDRDALRRKFNLNPNKKIVLFGSAKITDKRKGFDFLIQAFNNLLITYPNLEEDVEFLIFGNFNKEIYFPCKTHYLSFISSEPELAEIYNLADVFVLPSLQDNLPNTVMESLTCGTPVVAFNSGGVPEMVKHKENGYLSQLGSAEDLARGIQWVLYEAEWGSLSKYARDFALSNYSQEIVATKYISLYKELLHA